MTKRSLAFFAEGVAALYALYGVFPLVLATQLAEDPLWFQLVLVLAGLSTIASGVLGFWFAAKWQRRLAGNRVDSRTSAPVP